MELSFLRLFGLAVGLGAVGFAAWRRRSLRNGDVLILAAIGLALVVVSTTGVVNGALDFFAFHRGGGRRILGVAVFALFVLFLLSIRALTQTARLAREVSAIVEGIAAETFRRDGTTERYRDRIAVVVPAYNEAESIGNVLTRIPDRVCDVETAVLVVDDGSRDATAELAQAHGAAVARLVANRGQGAALRAGFRLVALGGARIVVTLDGDGQHLPEEMERLVQPVLEGEVDLASGSRVLGHAARNQLARELGIVFFNAVISLITRTRVTDCANGYRAIRVNVLPTLVLSQDQFSNSELLIEAAKRRVRMKEVPVTVDRRLHGQSRKPAVVRYGMGFANAILRAWLR